MKSSRRLARLKNLQWSLCAGLLAAFVGISGCSKAEDSNLVVSFGQSKAFMIEAKAASCTQRWSAYFAGTDPIADIAERNFSILNPQIEWKDTGSLATIAYLRITIKHSNLASDTYTCTIVNDELATLFGNLNTAQGWDFILPTDIYGTSSLVTQTNNICKQLRCGGIALKDSKRPFVATADVEVVGFSVSSNGEEKPIKARTTFLVENLP